MPEEDPDLPYLRPSFEKAVAEAAAAEGSGLDVELAASGFQKQHQDLLDRFISSQSYAVDEEAPGTSDTSDSGDEVTSSEAESESEGEGGVNEEGNQRQQQQGASSSSKSVDAGGGGEGSMEVARGAAAAAAAGAAVAERLGAMRVNGVAAAAGSGGVGRQHGVEGGAGSSSSDGGRSCSEGGEGSEDGRMSRAPTASVDMSHKVSLGQ